MESFLIDVIAPIVIVIFSGVLVYLYNIISIVIGDDDEDDKYTPENTMMIYAERVKDRVLVYDFRTHMFLVQVKTQEELFDYFQNHDYYSTLNIVAGEDNLVEVFGEEINADPV